MKKVIYYVVDKELQSYDNHDSQETTGNKTVTVYEVKDGKIVESFSIEQTNDENSHEGIIDYLVDNGYTENTDSVCYEPYYLEFEFVEL